MQFQVKHYSEMVEKIKSQRDAEKEKLRKFELETRSAFAGERTLLSQCFSCVGDIMKAQAQQQAEQGPRSVAQSPR